MFAFFFKEKKNIQIQSFPIITTDNDVDTALKISEKKGSCHCELETLL